LAGLSTIFSLSMTDSLSGSEFFMHVWMYGNAALSHAMSADPFRRRVRLLAHRGLSMLERNSSELAARKPYASAPPLSVIATPACSNSRARTAPTVSPPARHERRPGPKGACGTRLCTAA
jgi:hypothetical protein